MSDLPLTALTLLAVCIVGAVASAEPEVRTREALAWTVVVAGVVVCMGVLS